MQAAILLTCATPVYAQTYEPALVPPQILGSPTTMTPLSLGDDASRRISLGFEFEYWGQTFTDAWVSSNGFVSFRGAANLCCSGRPLEQAQRNTIYAYWSDLVSYTGNPYYRRDDGSILFGWYGTSEYNTNNSSTFEIGLFANGDILLNYGSLGFSGSRDFSAGITGPSAGDNISLFFGRNAQSLQNQSSIFTRSAPEPEPEIVAVDCRTTPMDPSCPQISIDPVAAISAAVEQSAEIEPEAMEQVREVAAEVMVAAEKTATETAAREGKTVERLKPAQVAALSTTGEDVADSTQSQDANAQETQDAASSGTFTTQSQLDNIFGMSFVQGPSMPVGQELSPLGMAISAGSPLSRANTAEALGLNSPPPVASGRNAPQSEDGMSEGQSETISAMGAVPGFAAYTQASLQDRADFYAIRDIYSRLRLQDANFELYRLMQTNDARWQEMVDEQYR